MLKNTIVTDMIEKFNSEYLTLDETLSPLKNPTLKQIDEMIIAVWELHELGFVHRALKPSSFKMDNNVKLGDFRHVTFLTFKIEPPKQEENGYKSPEVIKKDRSYDIQCLGYIIEWFMRDMEKDFIYKTVIKIAKSDNPPTAYALKNIIDGPKYTQRFPLVHPMEIKQFKDCEKAKAVIAAHYYLAGNTIGPKKDCLLLADIFINMDTYTWVDPCESADLIYKIKQTPLRNIIKSIS